MIEGLNIKNTIEFTSKNDVSDPKTVFVLRPLKAHEILDAGNVSDGKMRLSGQYVVQMIESSVVEIRNYNTEGTIREKVESLPLSVMTELINKISEINNLSEKEAKN